MNILNSYFENLQYAVNILTSIDWRSPNTIQADLHSVADALYQLDFKSLISELLEKDGGSLFNKYSQQNRCKCFRDNVISFLEWGENEINSVINTIIEKSPIHRKYAEISERLGNVCAYEVLQVFAEECDNIEDGFTDTEFIRGLYLEKRDELFIACGLTPHPNTSTEQEQRVEQNIILQRKDIKLIFDKAVSCGLMKFEDGYYCWLKKSELLAYFCKQVSLKCDLAEKYSEKTGEPQTNWKVFSGVFKIIARQGKNKGCWSLQTGRQIEGFMKGYMKYYSTFAPNGCELVDDLF